MAKMLVVDSDKCTGCRSCEVACSMRAVGAFQPSESRIHAVALRDGEYFTAVTCLQCGDPACMRACPENAIIKTDAGVVLVVSDRCTGCKACVQACPFGAISYSEILQDASKCDLCGGEPECATSCFAGAIELLEDIDAALRKKKAYAASLIEDEKEVD